jgi:hypothetical protein
MEAARRFALGCVVQDLVRQVGEVPNGGKLRVHPSTEFVLAQQCLEARLRHTDHQQMPQLIKRRN